MFWFQLVRRADLCLSSTSTHALFIQHSLTYFNITHYEYRRINHKISWIEVNKLKLAFIMYTLKKCMWIYFERWGCYRFSTQRNKVQKKNRNNKTIVVDKCTFTSLFCKKKWLLSFWNHVIYWGCCKYFRFSNNFVEENICFANFPNFMIVNGNLICYQLTK